MGKHGKRVRHIRTDSSLEDHPTNPVALHVNACYLAGIGLSRTHPHAHKVVLTDNSEHLLGTPGYTPKWKARLVACRNCAQMNGEDIRAAPTAEQEGMAG